MKCLRCGKETGCEIRICTDCIANSSTDNFVGLNLPTKKKSHTILVLTLMMVLMWAVTFLMFFLLKGNNDFFNVSYINIEDDWISSPIAFEEVYASSTLADKYENNYDVAFVCDNDEKTAWFEGVKGNGENEYIIFSSDNSKTIRQIDIINGCCYPYARYYRNSRMKKCAVELDGGVKFEVDFRDEYDKKTVIKFDMPISTKSVKIIILETYKGTECDDTAVSEIVFS